MKDRKGFTLIEILAVIVIIGILAIIVVPSVTIYLTNTRSETFIAHEKTMEEAAKSYTVDCINGQNPCTLPAKGNSKELHLKELIEKEYSSRLQNPQGKNTFCDEEKSYVIITNDNDEYEFESCLYCGSYSSKNSKCEMKESHTIKDDTPPICGTVENGSTEWTHGARTVTIGCSDPDSGCTREKYSETFNETLSTGVITIKNRAGKTTDCPVNVYVDNEKPTCELELVPGTYTQESTGWISGDNIQVTFKSKNDAHSGLFTYGLGTSYRTPDYNKQDTIKITSATGTTTVFGYVKDKVGNEEKCNLMIRTGIGKPDFDIYYGYQILPLKEKHSVSGMNITDNGKVTTTSANPKLTFTGMNKYTNVKRVVIVTEGTTLENSVNYKLKYDSNSISSLINGNRIEFDITKGSYNTYEFTLGTQNNKTINIKRIELEVETGNMPTNKQVTVNLLPKPTNIVELTGFSFDNGKNFISEYYKYFDITSGDVSGIAQTCDDIPMYSDKKNFYIKKGDATFPTINISANKTTWTNTDVILTGTGQDSGSGIIAYGFSKNTALTYNSTNWTYITNTKNSVSYTNPIQTNGTYYFNLKDEAGNTNEAHLFVNWIDKLKPVCEITGNSKVSCNDPKNTDYAASMISSYVFGKNASTSSSFTNVTATEKLSVDTTVNEEGKWNLYAKDRAGNISNLASYDYYKVTYDKNSGDSCNKSSAILRSGQAVDLTPTCTRTGYSFGGWSLNGVKQTSLNISSNITLKAMWTLIPFTITYTYNGGTAPSSGVPSTYTYGTGATINGKPTRNDYTFNGWSDNSSLTNPEFTKTISKTATGNKNFYARWCQNCAQPSNGTCTLNANTAGTCSYSASCNTGYTVSGNGTRTPNCTANTYTIEFNGNGNTGGSTGTVTCTYNQNCVLTENGFSKTGHTFNGWAISSSGEVKYSNKQTVKNLASSGKVTLYAKWKKNQNTLVVDANGGTGGFTATQEYNTTKSISVSRSEYAFDGWESSGPCGNYSSAASTTYTFPANSGTTCTLRAKWRIINCDKNKYRDGNSCVNCPSTHPYSDAGSTSISNCYRTGKYVTNVTRSVCEVVYAEHKAVCDKFYSRHDVQCKNNVWSTIRDWYAVDSCVKQNMSVTSCPNTTINIVDCSERLDWKVGSWTEITRARCNLIGDSYGDCSYVGKTGSKCYKANFYVEHAGTIEGTCRASSVSSSSGCTLGSSVITKCGTSSYVCESNETKSGSRCYHR